VSRKQALRLDAQCPYTEERQQGQEDQMREFQCGTLVPGCEWEVRGEDDAEIVKRAVQHLKQAHGETIIRESMVENIKSRIKESRSAA
jgi:predicted small metal-binding protein